MKRLIIFDFDGTLAPFPTGPAYPHVVAWFQQHGQDGYHFAIASNQGGVGFRLWQEMEGFGQPRKYPTELEARDRINRTIREIGVPFRVYLSFPYQAKGSGAWSPTPPGKEEDPEWKQAFRKPFPYMLVRACQDIECWPSEAVMVGDNWNNEDKGAAKAAGIQFVQAPDFFTTWEDTRSVGMPVVDESI